MDFYIGTIILLASIQTPDGFIPCDGSVYYIQQYQPLFALIGTNFGGNGQNTFAVPDLSKASPISGVRYFICFNGSFPPLS